MWLFFFSKKKTFTNSNRQSCFKKRMRRDWQRLRCAFFYLVSNDKFKFWGWGTRQREGRGNTLFSLHSLTSLLFYQSQKWTMFYDWCTNYYLRSIQLGFPPENKPTAPYYGNDQRKDIVSVSIHSVSLLFASEPKSQQCYTTAVSTVPFMTLFSVCVSRLAP